MNLSVLFVSIVVTISLIGVAVGRYPILRMNRATIALVGASLLVLSGALTMEEAAQAIDYNTILLLFSMMVLNINLRIAGFFRLLASWISHFARSPRQLLALLIFPAGLLSALFLNDTIVLMFTPLILEIVQSLKRNPLPYLIALAAAANIGSVATLVGNPQNMLVGLASGIPFIRFTSALLPLAVVGLGVVWLVVVISYRSEFDPMVKFELLPSVQVRTHLPLLQKSILAVLLMLAAFLLGAPVALAALTAAVILLITRRLHPERVFIELDWGLLVFFSGLFVITHSLQVVGVVDWLLARVDMAQMSIPDLALIAVILSNLVSNVPAVMLLTPAMQSISNPETGWLTIAMATTFAGNLTLVGSVANLIVAESAARKNVHLGFLEYLRVGLPVTLITMLFGVLWLGL